MYRVHVCSDCTLAISATQREWFDRTQCAIRSFFVHLMPAQQKLLGLTAIGKTTLLSLCHQDRMTLSRSLCMNVCTYTSASLVLCLSVSLSLSLSLLIYIYIYIKIERYIYMYIYIYYIYTCISVSGPRQ